MRYGILSATGTCVVRMNRTTSSMRWRTLFDVLSKNPVSTKLNGGDVTKLAAQRHRNLKDKV
jgi:hypothetical protein